MTTRQSASLVLQDEVKRGSIHSEPKAPLNGGGEAPGASPEFFTRRNARGHRMASAPWPFVASVCLAILLPSGSLASPGIDALAGDPARLRLPQGSARVSLGMGMRVHGLPLRAEVFQTSASLRETADLIASQPGKLPSLRVLPGAVLLAWQAGPHHWLARLTQAPGSLIHGTISVLTTGQSASLARQGEAKRGGSYLEPKVPPEHNAEADWLPAYPKLLFALDGAQDTGDLGDATWLPKRVQQRIHTHELAPHRLWPHIHERLRQGGWHRESSRHGPGGVERWVQGARSLTLLVVPWSGGSGMISVESAPR